MTGDVTSATWSTEGHSLAVVFNNSLYQVQNNVLSVIIAITTTSKQLQFQLSPSTSGSGSDTLSLISDGDSVTRLATPPPMYTETIWHDSTCVWWSPGSDNTLAFVTWSQHIGSISPVFGIRVATIDNIVNVREVNLKLDPR